MVTIQAQTMRVATPQRTAEKRWTDPTPTMAPVMVWVVETGMPARAVPNRVIAPAASAQKPPTGRKPGNFLAHGVDDAPAAEIRSRGNGGMGSEDDGPMQVSPIGEHVFLTHKACSVESAGDDAHGFLRIVAAVAETVAGGGEQLQLAKPGIDLVGSLVSQEPIRAGHEDKPEHKAHDRRNDDEDQSLIPTTRDDDGGGGTPAGMDGGVHHGGARVTADQGMRRRSRQAPPPGKQIPHNGPKQPA